MKLIGSIAIGFIAIFKTAVYFEIYNNYFIFCGAICLTFGLWLFFRFIERKLKGVPKGYNFYHIKEVSNEDTDVNILVKKRPFDIWLPYIIFIVFLLITIYKVYVGDISWTFE